MRIDGSCVEYQRLPASYRRALVSRLKIMARLDIAERRKPQDGKIKFRLPQGREIELRVATIPTAQGDEDVVMRLLAASEPLPLEALQMTARNLREVRRLLDEPYGLFLVVGPTGSGKTTTLHAALGAINTPDKNLDGGRPGGDHPVRLAPGAGAAAHWLHVCGGDAGVCGPIRTSSWWGRCAMRRRRTRRLKRR